MCFLWWFAFLLQHTPDDQLCHDLFLLALMFELYPGYINNDNLSWWQKWVVCSSVGPLLIIITIEIKIRCVSRVKASIERHHFPVIFFDQFVNFQNSTMLSVRKWTRMLNKLYFTCLHMKQKMRLRHYNRNASSWKGTTFDFISLFYRYSNYIGIKIVKQN